LPANVTGRYQVVSLVFVPMIALPWLLLTRRQRIRIGLVRPARWRWVLPAAIAGVAMALTVYVGANYLWGHTLSNPFAYIALSYSNVPQSPSDVDRLIYFIIVAVIGMLFSPIRGGAYRGIAHESIAASVGDRAAAFVDAAAFAVTHLAHFGVVFISRRLGVLASACTCLGCDHVLGLLMFYGFRKLTGSLVGAIAATRDSTWQ
jgi:hypothetical protein